MHVTKTRGVKAADYSQGPSVRMGVDLSLPVLVVDDYPQMRRILHNLLKELRFKDIEEAGDGVNAYRKLKARTHGLVISDWNMQPMTGFELLKAVRADDELADLPFIMITAENNTENVIAAKKAGVSGYIIKPFNAETLRKKIAAVK